MVERQHGEIARRGHLLGIVQPVRIDVVGGGQPELFGRLVHLGNEVLDAAPDRLGDGDGHVVGRFDDH